MGRENGEHLRADPVLNRLGRRARAYNGLQHPHSGRHDFFTLQLHQIRAKKWMAQRFLQIPRPLIDAVDDNLDGLISETASPKPPAAEDLIGDYCASVYEPD